MKERGYLTGEGKTQMYMIACLQIKVCHEREITDLFCEAPQGRTGTRSEWDHKETDLKSIYGRIL